MKKQKNMKKTGRKWVNRRTRVKYPALNKGMNLSSRKDYIEPEYIKGTFDKDGRQVIRPLNDKEMDFLNKFYEETVVTNFYHNPELRNLNKQKRQIIECETIFELKKEIKRLEQNKKVNRKRIKELKEIIKITKKQNEEVFSEELVDLEVEIQDLREELLLYPDTEDHKVFYNENNSRNNCIFNKKRITGKLLDLNVEEYDAFVTQESEFYDGEYIPEEEYDPSLEEKYKEIAEEVKQYFKDQKS